MRQYQFYASLDISSTGMKHVCNKMKIKRCENGFICLSWVTKCHHTRECDNKWFQISPRPNLSLWHSLFMRDTKASNTPRREWKKETKLWICSRDDAGKAMGVWRWCGRQENTTISLNWMCSQSRRSFKERISCIVCSSSGWMLRIREPNLSAATQFSAFHLSFYSHFFRSANITIWCWMVRQKFSMNKQMGRFRHGLRLVVVVGYLCNICNNEISTSPFKSTHFFRCQFAIEPNASKKA